MPALWYVRPAGQATRMLLPVTSWRLRQNSSNSCSGCFMSALRTSGITMAANGICEAAFIMAVKKVTIGTSTTNMSVSFGRVAPCYEARHRSTRGWLRVAAVRPRGDRPEAARPARALAAASGRAPGGAGGAALKTYRKSSSGLSLLRGRALVDSVCP